MLSTQLPMNDAYSSSVMITCIWKMDHVFSVQAIVRGYHYYQAIWEAGIDGEVLLCEREVGNVHNMFAVTIKQDDTTVGHCPQKISSICSIFIRRGGSTTCQVNGNRRYSQDLPQGGLEVPCILTFCTSDKTNRKANYKCLEHRN